MKKLYVICCLISFLSACGGENLSVEPTPSELLALYNAQIVVEMNVAMPSTLQSKPLQANEAKPTATTQLTVAVQDLLGRPLRQVSIQLDQTETKFSDQNGLVVFDAVRTGKHDVHFLSENHEWISIYQTDNKNILWRVAALEDSYLQFQGSLKNFDVAQAGHNLELVFLHPSEQRVLGRSYCYTFSGLFRCIGVLSGIATDSYSELDVWAIERNVQQRVVNGQQIAYNFVYYGQDINSLSIAYAHNINFPKPTKPLTHLFSAETVNAISGVNTPIIEASAFAPGGHGMILDVQSTWPSDLYAFLPQKNIWAIALATNNEAGFWSVIQKVEVSSTVSDMYATLTGSGNIQPQTLASTEQETLFFNQLTDDKSIQQLLIRDTVSSRTLWKIYFPPQVNQIQLPAIVQKTIAKRLLSQHSYKMQLQLWLMGQLAYDQALVHMGNPYGLSLHQRLEIIASGVKVLRFL